jgi:hypothetical protein
MITFVLFLKTLKKRGYPHLTFVALTKSIGYYFFMPEDIYRLDCIRSGIQFIDKRDCCGSYDETIRSTLYKASDFSMPTDDFICRSEYYFSSLGTKSPLIIVGLDTAVEMKVYGLRECITIKYFCNISTNHLHTDANGNHMRPLPNNSGLRIQNNFIRPQRFDALKGFYDNYPIKYWDARRDFYRNNHIMRKWRP